MNDHLHAQLNLLTTEEKAIYAANCLKNYCHAKGITHPYVDELIEYIQSIDIYDSLIDWHDHADTLHFLGDIAEIPSEIEGITLDSIKDEFYDLAAEAFHVGATDMYAAPSQEPFETVLRILDTLDRNGIALPSVLSAKTGRKTKF